MNYVKHFATGKPLCSRSTNLSIEYEFFVVGLLLRFGPCNFIAIYVSCVTTECIRTEDARPLFGVAKKESIEIVDKVATLSETCQ